MQIILNVFFILIVDFSLYSNQLYHFLLKCFKICFQSIKFFPCYNIWIIIFFYYWIICIFFSITNTITFEAFFIITTTIFFNFTCFNITILIFFNIPFLFIMTLVFIFFFYITFFFVQINLIIFTGGFFTIFLVLFIILRLSLWS